MWCTAMQNAKPVQLEEDSTTMCIGIARCVEEREQGQAEIIYELYTLYLFYFKNISRDINRNLSKQTSERVKIKIITNVDIKAKQLEIGVKLAWQNHWQMPVGRKQRQLLNRPVGHLDKNKFTGNDYTITICSICLCGIVSVSINASGSNVGTQISKGFGRLGGLGGFDKIADGTELIALAFNMFLSVSEELDLEFRVFCLSIGEEDKACVYPSMQQDELYPSDQRLEGYFFKFY